MTLSKDLGLSSLATEDKSSIVSAINENVASIKEVKTSVESVVESVEAEMEEVRASLEETKNISEEMKVYVDQEVKGYINTHKTEDASLTKKGHVQLSNATDSDSDALAATPSAVKKAYSKGETAYFEVGEVHAELNAFKAALTEGFTANFFSDGLSTLDAFIVTNGYYNQAETRLEV